MAETGTILITGANGSLAVPAVKYLLSKSATYTCILTVRNTSDNDVNTKRLRETLPQYQGAGSRISIRQLDLSNLSAVHEFARTIASEVANGKLPPLAGIVCNAFYWNLTGDAELTGDGYDKSVQVNHIAHAALVLRLLGSFGAQGGRIVLFSSDAHWPGKNGLEKYPPAMPDDLELLVKPVPDSPPDNMGRGFQRYAVSKLAVTMWMYALNRYLQKACLSSKMIRYHNLTCSIGPEPDPGHCCRHQSW
jgi:NAD(P)-dependent dehydrogenase (short-subunit alcohol dehydrogenase family)